MNKIIQKALDNPKTKAFWKKPEGKAAVALGVLAIIIIIWFLPKIIKLVFIIAGNLILAIIGLTVIALIVFTISYSKTRKGLFVGFKQALKKVASIFAEINPFVKLKKNLSALIKNSKEINAILDQVHEIKGELDVKKLKTEKDLDENKQIMQIAKASGNENQFAAQAKYVTRETAVSERITILSGKIDAIKDALSELRYDTQEDIVDILEEMRQKHRLRRETNRKLSFKQRFKNLFDEDNDETHQIDHAIGQIADVLKQKVRLLGPLTDQVRTFVDSINLKNVEFDNHSAEMLDKAIYDLKKLHEPEEGTQLELKL